MTMNIRLFSDFFRENFRVLYALERRGGSADTLSLMLLAERDEERRFHLRGLIAQYQRDGKVWLEESGMDCDCMQYGGRIHEIDATLDAYEQLLGELNQWADGPFSLVFLHPDRVVDVDYWSRDLALEAYENGHPHAIFV